MFSRRISRKFTLVLFLAFMAMVVMWTVFGKSDADIQWVGPKTKMIREICARLDVPIEADWQKITTVGDALNLLHEELAARNDSLPVLINHLALEQDGFQGDALQAPIVVRSSISQVSGKQILKTIIAQFPSKNATFHVRNDPGYLVLTTKAEVELDRAWYHKAYNVSHWDMALQRCGEFFRREGNLPAAPANGRGLEEALARQQKGGSE